MAGSAAAAAAPARRLGMSDPLSLEGPTPSDEAHTAELMAVLRDFGLFEAEEESRQREQVLGTLNSIVQDWAKQVALKQVRPRASARTALPAVECGGARARPGLMGCAVGDFAMLVSCVRVVVVIRFARRA
jgi:poly(A) polymerase Pap1